MRLRGNLEQVRRGWIKGWAADMERPDRRQTIVVALGDREVARQVADAPRQDLAGAGIGDGRYGFAFTFACGDRPGADALLRVRVEGADFELPGSPRPYRAVAPFNLVPENGLALSAQKRPLALDLTEAELARIAFEPLPGEGAPALRVWLTHPPRPGGSDSPETVLLRWRLPAVGPDEMLELVAGVEARARCGSAPALLRLRSLRNGREIGRQERPAMLDSAWFDLSLEATTNAPLPGQGEWLFELATTATAMMSGVEFRNPRFGAAPPIAQAAAERREAAVFYRPPASGYSTSSLLSSIEMLVQNPGGAPTLSPDWAVIKGRGGEFDVDLSFQPWSPLAEDGLQARALSRFEIGTNTFYVRFAHALDPARLARLPTLATELIVGADAPPEARSGLAVRVFVRAVTADGAEAILPLAPRTEVKSQMTLMSGASAELAGLLGASDCKLMQYVVEITGTGNLLLGPIWLGDGALAAMRPGRVSAAADAAAREWRYQRFVETTESVFLPRPGAPRLAVFVVAAAEPAGAACAEAIAASVRSFLRQGARVSVAAPSSGATDAVEEALRRALSLKDFLRVGLEFPENLEALAAAFAAFAARCEPDELVMTVGAGATARLDLREALRRAREEQDVDYVVFDHDRRLAGRRVEPVLKPGLSSHLLLETDYVGPGVAFRAGALPAVLEDRAISPALPFGTRDALLRLMETGKPGAKIDHVLLHLGGDPFVPTVAEERAFIDRVLARRNAHATVRRWGRELSVRYRASGEPLVSIVIVFRDKADYLERCVASIFARTAWPRYEIVLVDNESREPETAALLQSLARDPRVRITPFPKPFNYSAANNLGAKAAAGEFLIFMNNDVEALSPDWIDALVGAAALPDTGLVGPRLHFANGRVQHAGIVLGLRGMAGHALAGEHDVAVSAMLARHTRDVTAVTGAVMAVKADRFWELGGFDERFVLTGNDVDLCLRARRRGLRNLYVGSVQLFHFEKASRDAIPVYMRDLQLSLEAYEPELSTGDPFWNRLFSRERGEGAARGPIEPDAGDARRQAAEKRVRTMQARNLGPDAVFLALYDADRATIAANREANRRFMTGGGPPVRTAAYFVPHVDHIYRGGVFTCFRFAAALWRDRGVEPTVIVCGERRFDGAGLERQLRRAFPDTPFRVRHVNPLRDAPSSLPPADIAVATLWTTAYVMSRYPARGKFYLIQDYEPLFESSGAGYGLIEASYRFGYFPICNSAGVAEAIAPYSSTPMLTFDPPVDRTTFFPLPGPKPGDAPVRIVFYGRPNNPRNLFGLGVHALLELKDVMRDAIEIVSAGGVFDPKDYGAEGKILNLGLLPGVESVAALYRTCDIGLVFMQSKHPSYQPLEYMASGCATVTNHNEANAWLLRDRENCLLTQITLSSVVESLIELIENPGLRRSIQAGGLETVAGRYWPDIETEVVSFLMDPGNGAGRGASHEQLFEAQHSF